MIIAWLRRWFSGWVTDGYQDKNGFHYGKMPKGYSPETDE